MKSSPLIMLFGSPPPSRRGPSGFLISLVVHAFAFALLFLGLNQPHKVDLRSDNLRFSVRIMELHQQEPKVLRFTQSGTPHPGQEASTHAPAPGGGPQSAPAQRIPLNLLTEKKALETLVQPDVPHNIMIPQEATLPQMVVWSSRDIAMKKIIPTPPKPTPKADVQASLEPPNDEVRVADIRITSTPFESKTPSPPPSKTSPVNVQSPQAAQQVPETTSRSSGRATPASVISLSEIKLQDGTAALPMISEVSPTTLPGSLSAGAPKSLSETGTGKTVNDSNGGSSGHTSGDQPGKGLRGSAAPGQGQGGANGPPGSATGTAESGQGGNDTGSSQRTVVHITLPRDGQFGVVVVGSSPADDYQETIGLWSGRLAYTVYLRVGVTKKWIMQYSLPHIPGSASATVTRPDAPFPYDIIRPSIDPDVNADAILVHGFVNTAGRFEQLAVIFPTELAEAKFLLHALQQWQFRPAMQNGQAAIVEVLIIIPDQTE